MSELLKTNEIPMLGHSSSYRNNDSMWLNSKFCFRFSSPLYNQNLSQGTLGRVSTFKFPRRTKNSMYYPLIRA